MFFRLTPASLVRRDRKPKGAYEPMPVMIPTVLKNLFGGPATRLYPITVPRLSKMPEARLPSTTSKCTLCGACALRCPADAISIDKEKKTLNFHPARCIVCEVCVIGCPSDAIDLGSKWRTPFYKKPVEVHEGRQKTGPPCLKGVGSALLRQGNSQKSAFPL